MSRIAILTKSCKYFAVPFLAKALGADLYTMDHTQDTFFGGGDNVRTYENRKIDCEHLIVIGTRALLAIKNHISSYKSVAVVFSDTNCCILRDAWLPLVKRYGVTVYAMPDLFQYCTCEKYPIYQTMTLPKMDTTKTEGPVTILHSPGKKAQHKGTREIMAVVNLLKQTHDIKLKILTKETWFGCLREKAGAHIFIDQLVYKNRFVKQSRFGGKIPYLGALGKSGLEAMLLGCCTVTGSPVPDVRPYYAIPPVIFTDVERVYNDLEMLITNPETRQQYAEKQREWAEYYLSPAFMASHITRHIKSETV